ncbi:MAG: hypothetical protein J7L23_00520 [Candidatus Diapherotrites archaeon]|nr:hypothetical protein [Candidatus Diapherotrites archaeon]
MEKRALSLLLVLLIVPLASSLYNSTGGFYYDVCDNGIGYSAPGPYNENCTKVDCCYGQETHVHEVNAKFNTSSQIKLTVKVNVSVPEEYNEVIPFSEIKGISNSQPPSRVYNSRAKVKINVWGGEKTHPLGSIECKSGRVCDYTAYLPSETREVRLVRVEIDDCYATGKFLNASSPGIYDYRKLDLMGCHVDWSEVKVEPATKSGAVGARRPSKDADAGSIIFLILFSILFMLLPLLIPLIIFIVIIMIVWKAVKTAGTTKNWNTSKPGGFKSQKPKKPGFWG